MSDEGYIKFEVRWTEAPPLPAAELRSLDGWRQQLYELGLIGAYPGGIGFGNISRRFSDSDQFIISGSATGNHSHLQPEHYALVTDVDIDTNTLWCQGPIVASSESMSHAVIYRQLPSVDAVIHVHHLGMWERLLHRVPTTDAAAAYGSPEMARSIVDLLRHTDLPEQKIFVMEGHREGIFTFGGDLEEAGQVLLVYFKKGYLP